MTDSGTEPILTVRTAASGEMVVCGDIDIAGGPVLDAALVAAEAAASGPIVLDLGAVSFIDSSGLRCLLAAGRRARARDASVVLRQVGPEVARLLQITGTADLFMIESHRV